MPIHVSQRMRRSSRRRGAGSRSERLGGRRGPHPCPRLPRCLPEEQVGADGGAEHGHDHHGGRTASNLKCGQTVRQRDVSPGHMDGEQHRRVGQQRQGQPFQERDIAVIGHEHLQPAGCRRRRRPSSGAGSRPITSSADLAHGGHVGAMFSVLATSSSSTTPWSKERREHGLDVRRQALAGDPADARAHRLDRRHQRIGQRHGPQHVQPELGAGLRIGGDAAGIVVGDAR
jgi:hypothetical protein